MYLAVAKVTKNTTEIKTRYERNRPTGQAKAHIGTTLLYIIKAKGFARLMNKNHSLTPNSI